VQVQVEEGMYVLLYVFFFYLCPDFV